MKKIVLAAMLAAGALLLGTGMQTKTAEAANVNMYRMYNSNTGEHFYTAAQKERDYLVEQGWKYEGIGWTAPETSKSPVYRLYNANTGDHHYTMSAKEMDYLVSIGWTYEKVGWYSDDAKGVPIYRQYNKSAKVGAHNYTTSKKENNYLVKQGWTAEGIGWYGVKTANVSEISQGLDKLTKSELAGRTVHVSFSKSDVTSDDVAGPILKLTVYVPAEFRRWQITGLEIGDTLTINKKNVLVESIEYEENDYGERTGKVLINGGRTKENGYDLKQDTSTGYYYVANADGSVHYYTVGSTTIHTSTDFEFTDHYDKNKAVTYNAESFLSELSSLSGSFTSANTTVSINSDGEVFAMYRTAS